MRSPPEALRYAVRPSVLVGYGGRLCLVVGGVASAPLLVAVICGETDAALRYAAVAASSVLAGLWSRRAKDVKRVQANEAMALAVLAFVLASAAMVFPWMAEDIDFADAVFESVSGVTTTGLTTLADIESKSTSFLFARAWMQWCGGLGFVIMSLVLFMPRGMVAKDLAVTEDIRDDLLGGTRAFTRKVAGVYLAMSLGAYLFLSLAGGGFRDAALYALAAVSTGGFAPRAGSLAGTPGFVFNLVVLLACLAGSFPLIFYFRMMHGRRMLREYFVQVIGVIGSGLLVSLVVLWALGQESPASLEQMLYHAAMLGYSSQTTAGFSTLDTALLPGGAKAALIAGMAVGGGMGSTAGGFKILRLLIVARLVQLLVYRTSIAPHTAFRERFAGRRLKAEEIRTHLLVILLFGAVVFVSWIAFVTVGFDPVDSLFEVVSATGTVGLSTGVTSAGLPAALKLILCVDMLLGRLEFVAVLVCLSPRSWIGRHNDA